MCLKKFPRTVINEANSVDKSGAANGAIIT